MDRLKLFLICISLCSAYAKVGESPEDYVFSTNKLPTDERYLCSIGNGHLAANVLTDTIYMNGLFNGERGESHRARIPAWSNIRILNSTIDQAINGSATYTLDTFLGLFRTTVDTPKIRIRQSIFAHRNYSRAIVNQFSVDTTGLLEATSFELGLFPGEDSEDIDFDEPELIFIEQRAVWKTCGQTLKVEDIRYQPEPSKICVYYTDVPNNITVPGNLRDAVYYFVMTADNSDTIARKEMEDILKLNGYEVYESHVERWNEILKAGDIEITGNSQLSKIVNGAWYYLLSSLPTRNTNQPLGPFYGLSPGGLARGGLLKDYQGHGFWDTETWMYPPILMMHPNIASNLLQYRIRNMQASKDLAILSGHSGIRYAWESAFTGTEVTPDCCPEVVDFEHHITGCIAFAARQYIAMTDDMDWLNNGGCEFVQRMAEFWASRVIYNNDTKFYDIRNVMGPDEDHPNVTNSVFTNVVAGLSLYFGDYASCLCNDSSPNSNWSSIARKLALTYDADLDYHPQNEEYERPTMIKQADAVLLAFPLMYQMNDSTKENNLKYYENVTRENGPAMTWSMHTIGHLQLDDNEQAALLFTRSYQRYVREPFYIWTEAIEPEIGAVNFITGMGGFMQAILSGYGGINIHLDRLEIIKPQMIPNTTSLKINRIKYMGNWFTIHINDNQSLLTVNRVNPDKVLGLQIGTETTPLTAVNMTVTLSKELKNVISLTSRNNQCQLPLDLIGQKD